MDPPVVIGVDGRETASGKAVEGCRFPRTGHAGDQDCRVSGHDAIETRSAPEGLPGVDGRRDGTSAGDLN